MGRVHMATSVSPDKVGLLTFSQPFKGFWNNSSPVFLRRSMSNVGVKSCMTLFHVQPISLKPWNVFLRLFHDVLNILYRSIQIADGSPRLIFWLFNDTKKNIFLATVSVIYLMIWILFVLFICCYILLNQECC